MGFSAEVKTRVFIRSARICALCYKPCGTNIEVAHIVAKADQGGGDDSNGIPLCFDCHQEIGAYDDRHPRGNKFTAAELRARRDQLYRLVDSGSIQAQLVAAQVHAHSGSRLSHPSSVPELENRIDELRVSPSSEARAIYADAIAPWKPVEALPRKLSLLGSHDRAWVLDELVNNCSEGRAMDGILAYALHSDPLPETSVLIEQLFRRITLLGLPDAKARFMSLCPLNVLTSIDEDLRTTFFLDVIDMMERDQFEEVNQVTPAIVKVQLAIPRSLRSRYVRALLSQADSMAYQGAPAARTALSQLPPELATELLQTLSGSDVWSGSKYLHQLVDRVVALWPPEKAEMFTDYHELPDAEFYGKYCLTTEPSD